MDTSRPNLHGKYSKLLQNLSLLTSTLLSLFSDVTPPLVAFAFAVTEADASQNPAVAYSPHSPDLRKTGLSAHEPASASPSPAVTCRIPSDLATFADIKIMVIARGSETLSFILDRAQNFHLVAKPKPNARRPPL
ncbi:hypothetical protein ACJRO7_000453 [Eucalyptus globulus]|uniref:Uncharacterized protein n=1 Tax=Eucalyptus globulus TaxID=34317 RepID=A0ABD3LNV0_EUCGL